MNNKKNSSILGIGIDIEEIKRFQDLPFDNNKEFYQKIFTKEEIEYCLKRPNPYKHFAVRFCAKEAVIKALPQKINNLLDIVISSKNGKPVMEIKGLRGVRIHISLSRTKDYATALVIIEKK